MKNYLLILFAFISLNNSAQYVLGDNVAYKPLPQKEFRAPGALCLNCGPLSLFSNPPSLILGAGISDDLTCYTSYDNFYGLNEPIVKLFFWGYDIYPSGGDYYGCAPPAEKDFEIGFYYDNAGHVGNELVKFQISPGKSYCTDSYAYGNAPLYVYEVELPVPVDLQQGWISVRAISGQGNCWFAWGLAENGDALCWQQCSSFQSYQLDFAFCLLPEENEGVTVPLSGWAMGLGISLIVLLAILRWRRIA